MKRNKLLTMFAAAMMLLGAQNANAAVTYTALSATKFNNGEGAEKLLDGTGTTKWGEGLTTGNPRWLIFKTDKAVSATQYTLTVANDTPGSKGRQWTRWKIYGANFFSDASATKDATDWMLLDQKYCPTDTEFPTGSSNNTYQQTDFTMSEGNTGYYSYFKIVVEEIRTSGQYGQMGDFCFKAFNEKTVSETWSIKVNIAKSFDRETLPADDPLYTENTTKCDELDATRSAANSSSDYTTLTSQLDYIATLQTMMTTYIGGKEYVAIDGSVCWGDGHYSQLVDGLDGLEGRTGTKWGGNFSGSEGDAEHVQYCIFRVKTAFAPYFYKLVTGGDTSGWTGRNWKTWSVYGANFSSLSDATANSTSWVLLDEREDISEAYLPMENNYPAAFDFNQGVNDDYYYYMVKVFAAHNGSQIQMNEMYLCTQDEFETVLRAPLVAYFDDFDTTRPVEADMTDELAEFNTKFTQLQTTADAVQLTLLYNECVALRTQLELSMDYLDFYNAKAVNGVFQLATADDLKDFSELVNRGKSDMDAALTADITAPSDYTPIGYPKAYAYSGTFDGQGHAVTLSISNSNSYQALIGYAAGGAVIQNVITRGSVSGNRYCAGILGGADFDSGVSGTITISNCGNEADITASSINAAGIQGTNIAARATYVISNCYNTGTIVGTGGESAAISGYAGGSSSTVTNCYNTGSVTGVDDDTKSFVRGTPTYSNCYTTLAANTADGLTQSFDASKVASGELCHLLNGSVADGTTWTQTIGTDASPVLFAAGRTVHEYSTGVYTNLPLSGGKAQIANGTDLRQFAAEVNLGNTAMNAELTADINLSGIAWTPIGNGSKQYSGTFDGTGKAISNFNYTSTGNYNGLFGHINGATVKDFSISGTLTSTHTKNGVIGQADGTSVVSGIHSSLNITVDCDTHIGGVVGGTGESGHYVIIENCSYSGTLTINNHADAIGGILGYTYVGTVRNCLFNGTINGNVGVHADQNTGNDRTPHYGGILGYCRIETFGGIHNCLSIGKIVAETSANVAAIIGNWNGPATSNVTNNYYLLADGSTISTAIGNKANMISEAPVLVTAAQLASGEVAYKLNGNSVYEPAWFQNLSGTDDANPVLFSTHGIVNKISSAGYTTQFVHSTDVTIPTGIEAFAGRINGAYLTLVPIADAISKDDAVILRGSEGYYSFVPTTGVSQATNSLIGSDGTATGGDGIYALAKLTPEGASEPVVGFYKFTNTTKNIPAGKAYLNTSAGVKGFTFLFDDDATSINEE